ncbi:CaiB/BaiF CoA-transferase family protein [Phenylobacterium sp.]|uniref:CaiB/BaiF CoA transferase family protein n=1 Tax=Phenylobacterium sp. TaxID=1871053 RepID=UPI00301DA204
MGQGPLKDLKVVEFAGIGPGPFCGMLLSDLGADVLRITRPDQPPPTRFEPSLRGRRSVALDLKSPQGVETALRFVDQAEALFEGFRPGVMERLGLGPDVVTARKPRIVYGRMTGWGQYGPRAHTAGHDINYISLGGALHAIGPAERPIPPLNLVGDYGGGALYLAFGMVSAVLSARATGVGQVVDCAMSDCAANLLAPFYGMFASGAWVNARASNRLDGGAPYYGCYACADGKWISVGSLEKPFYELLLARLGLSPTDYPHPLPHARWPALNTALGTIFASQPRDHWCALLDETDACFAPVLDVTEAPQHPHNLARNTFIELDGVLQPAPAPRFSATPAAVAWPSAASGEAEGVYQDWGVTPA